MKKVIAFFALAGIMSISTVNAVAQDGAEGATPDSTGQMAPDSTTAEPAPVEESQEEAATAPKKKAGEEEAEKEVGFLPKLKQYFIDGGAEFMTLVLIALILGLAFVIERIIYLNMATTNTKKLLNQVEDALESGGVEKAKEICKNTSGPVASIFYQGLDRIDEGIENVEKSVVAYGGVQMGLLEKGLSWVSLFIALAPMLGFMGTVIGMIEAFNQIEASNDIRPEIVAGGIKQALLTTVFGLVVAIILQIFYNYLVAKVDSLVNQMEDASISLVDLLVKHELKNK